MLFQTSSFGFVFSVEAQNFAAEAPGRIITLLFGKRKADFMSHPYLQVLSETTMLTGSPGLSFFQPLQNPHDRYYKKAMRQYRNIVALPGL
ncbi:MAG: hypothetical protein ACI4UC_09465 [Alloprevotella sp.]